VKKAISGTRASQSPGPALRPLDVGGAGKGATKENRPPFDEVLCEATRRSDLFETGKLTDFAPGRGEQAGAFATHHPDDCWMDVRGPGDVHAALLAAGRLRDPYYGRQEEEARWVEDREWWYRFGFEGPAAAPEPDERLVLVCHGLDTFVTLWLNGKRLGEHRNMFREVLFDVTRLIRPGASNTLALCFHPPLRQQLLPPPDPWGPNQERVSMRKAQYGYGWDWGPACRRSASGGLSSSRGSGARSCTACTSPPSS
jgi:glycosyl hydrolase family 2